MGNFNRSRLREALKLYFVMPASTKDGRDPLWIAREAIAGGVTTIQLREKEADMSEVIRVGRELRTLCRDNGVMFIVNDRVDLALILDADGVHLGQSDIPYHEARQLVGADKIIGVSVSSLDEAAGAFANRPDYLGVGAIYQTSSKPDAGAPVGTGLIRELRQASDLPLVGIGGINRHNAAEVMAAGADGVAVISAILAAAQPRLEAAAIVKAGLNNMGE